MLRCTYNCALWKKSKIPFSLCELCWFNMEYSKNLKINVLNNKVHSFLRQSLTKIFFLMNHFNTVWNYFTYIHFKLLLFKLDKHFSIIQGIVKLISLKFYQSGHYSKKCKGNVYFPGQLSIFTWLCWPDRRVYFKQ